MAIKMSCLSGAYCIPALVPGTFMLFSILKDLGLPDSKAEGTNHTVDAQPNYVVFNVSLGFSIICTILHRQARSPNSWDKLSAII
jgi:hypothetical protein